MKNISQTKEQYNNIISSNKNFNNLYNSEIKTISLYDQSDPINGLDKIFLAIFPIYSCDYRLLRMSILKKMEKIKCLKKN